MASEEELAQSESEEGRAPSAAATEAAARAGTQRGRGR